MRGFLGSRSLSWRTHPLEPLCHLWAPELGSTRPQQALRHSCRAAGSSCLGVPSAVQDTPATGFPGHAVPGWPILELCGDPGVDWGWEEAGPSAWVGPGPREVWQSLEQTGAGPSGPRGSEARRAGRERLTGWGKRSPPRVSSQHTGSVSTEQTRLCKPAWGRGTQMGCGGVTQSPESSRARSPVSALEEPGPAAWGPRGWEGGPGGPSALELALPGPHPGVAAAP